MRAGLGLLAMTFISSCRTGGRQAKKPTVVSLNPAATEMIFAIEAQDHLLAVSDYCDYPEAAQRLPKVGDLVKPDMEAIIALNPDYVVVFLPTQASVKHDLEAVGIRTIDLSPESPQEVLEAIEKLGHIMGKDDRARFVVDSLQREMRSIAFPEKRPRVVVELSLNPVYVAGNNTFPAALVEAAGGENAFKDVQGYKPVQDEEINRRHPDMVIMAHQGPAPSQRLGWQGDAPVEIRMDPDLVSRPGPRFVQAVRLLNRAFNQWQN